MDKREKSDSAKDFIIFQNKRKIINLCKMILCSLEDAHEEGEMSEKKFQKMRKRILDYGNDTIRELEENLDSVNVSF